MQHGGRRDGDFGDESRGDPAFEEFKVSELNIVGVADFVHHADGRWRRLCGAIRIQDGDRDVGGHATELLQEVNVKIGAAKLAIGDRLQTHLFLECNDVGNGLVFDFAQF